MNPPKESMSALIYDGLLRTTRIRKPRRKENEVLIRVTKAGICNTDHEIIRGYVPGFSGVLGHEFIGVIEDAPDASQIGKRCTAEINFACQKCEFCKRNLQRHCPNRTVMGIIHQDGAFAEYLCAPTENVFLIPDAIPDTRAIFIEPLAAALEIFDQISVPPDSHILIFGDGKLGLLIAYAFAMRNHKVTIVGKHSEKLALLSGQAIETYLAADFKNGAYDIVVEATGNPDVFEMAVKNVKPRGFMVLKSTYAGTFAFNPSQIVVNEITVVGSRCGRFSQAIAFMLNNEIPLENLITSEFTLDFGVEAFKHSAQSNAVKVMLTIQND